MGQKQRQSSGSAGRRRCAGEVSTSPRSCTELVGGLTGPIVHRNYTIRFMPVPIVDAAQALKTNPEKTEDALLKVCVW